MHQRIDLYEPWKPVTKISVIFTDEIISVLDPVIVVRTAVLFDSEAVALKSTDLSQQYLVS